MAPLLLQPERSAGRQDSIRTRRVSPRTRCAISSTDFRPADPSSAIERFLPDLRGAEVSDRQPGAIDRASVGYQQAANQVIQQYGIP